MQIEELSKELLSNMVSGRENDNLEAKVKKIELIDLISELSNDDKRKAFWINIYNAYNILFLKMKPKLLESQKSRHQLYSKRNIIIGGHELSLNDIKHGMLRHSKIWWAKGYLSKLFISKFEKKFRVNIPDCRIHFVLNCGGLFCPPVGLYEGDKINQQLELATKAYLDSEVTYYAEENLVSISQIFNWYTGDFGGSAGILKLLKKYKKIPQDSTPVIIYKPYKWMPNIENYS